MSYHDANQKDKRKVIKMTDEGETLHKISNVTKLSRTAVKTIQKNHKLQLLLNKQSPKQTLTLSFK